MTTHYPTMQRREDQPSPPTFTLANLTPIDPEKTSTGGPGRVNKERKIWKPNKLQKWRSDA